jgi:hypothetical protein
MLRSKTVDRPLGALATGAELKELIARANKGETIALYITPVYSDKRITRYLINPHKLMLTPHHRSSPYVRLYLQGCSANDGYYYINLDPLYIPDMGQQRDAFILSNYWFAHAFALKHQSKIIYR